MDPLFIGGLLAIIGGIVISTLMDGNSFGPLLGPSSALLVFFGALGAGIAAYRLADVGRIPKALRYALSGSPPELDDSISTLAELAQVARRDGMLALEGQLDGVDDAFLRSGLQYLVDGMDAERVRELLDVELAAIDARHRTMIGFFRSVGAFAPTFGMVGTIIGLINMLGNLSNPEQLGAGMALALLTTLYGVLIANMIFIPIANRLQTLNSVELASREVAMDGILAIQAGVSPRLLVERLETFLPPEARVGHAGRTGERAAAA